MLLRRIGSSLATAAVSVVGVLTIIFVLVRLSGDPAELMSPPAAPPEQIAETRQLLGLDDPIAVQYGRFMSDALHGDLGTSYYWRTSAGGLVADHLGATLQLAIASAAFAVAAGVPLGLVAAFRQGSVVDRSLGVMAMIGQAIPSFWMAPVLILLVAVDLSWLPTGGRAGLSSFVLPVVSLGSFQLAVLYRVTRAAALEQLGQDHVRLVRAKGAGRLRVAAAHVLPGTALPLMTVTGLALASLIGGSVIVERIFSWPGIGNLMVAAVEERDFPVVQAVAVVYALAFIGINTIVDLLYVVVDPRLRHRAAV